MTPGGKREGAGRKKSENPARNRGFRMRDDLYARLVAAAEDVGLTPSEWLRRLVEESLPPAPPREP